MKFSQYMWPTESTTPFFIGRILQKEAPLPNTQLKKRLVWRTFPHFPCFLLYDSLRQVYLSLVRGIRKSGDTDEERETEMESLKHHKILGHLTDISAPRE